MNTLVFKQITKKNSPFFLGWIIICTWLEWFVLPVGTMSGTHTNAAFISVYSYIYYIIACLVICLMDIRKLLPYAKFSALLAIIGIIIENIFESSIISSIGVALTAIGVGHVYASTGYGFFFILNNSEKLYSTSTAILINIVSLTAKTYMPIFVYDTVPLSVQRVIGLIILFICSLYYGKVEHEQIDKKRNIATKDNLVLILVIIVFVFNDFLAPVIMNSQAIPKELLYLFFSMGALLGVILLFLTQLFFHMNMCYLLNFSLAVLTLGFTANRLFSEKECILFSTVLFGISHAIGFISLYYIIGIIVKKSKSLIFYKIGVFVSTTFYLFGFFITGLIEKYNSPELYSVIALLSVIILLLVFTFTPYFTKILYFAEWTDDLTRSDVTHKSRLEEKLSRLKLSPRETEVCKLLLDGYTMRQVSSILYITYSTVNTYCTAIYRKLNINSKTELLVMFSEYLSK